NTDERPTIGDEPQPSLSSATADGLDLAVPRARRDALFSEVFNALPRQGSRSAVREAFDTKVANLWRENPHTIDTAFKQFAEKRLLGIKNYAAKTLSEGTKREFVIGGRRLVAGDYEDYLDLHLAPRWRPTNRDAM